MVIYLLSLFSSILFRFRFIFGWCGCIDHMDCWLPLIDDCWRRLFIDDRDLWIFLVFFLFFVSFFDYLMASFLFILFFIFCKDSIFLSSNFTLVSWSKKKNHLLKNIQPCFIQYVVLKKKKCFSFLGSHMDKNSCL